MTDSPPSQNPDQDQTQSNTLKSPLASSKISVQTQIPDTLLEPDKLFQLISQECLSLSEAAKLTGYHEDYLGQRSRLGELRAIKIGKNWITHRSCLDDFCKTHPGAYSHRPKRVQRRKKLKNITTIILPEAPVSQTPL
jgi:hypothetical protein